MTLVENERKFLEFYDRSITKIYRYVYFRVGSEQIAQDISSEAFLRAWQYLKDGKDIGNLSAMVYQICRNLIADYFRKNKSLLISLDESQNLPESESNLLQQAGDKIDVEVIKHHLRLLKVEYQEIIIWRYIDDFEIPEIAQITGKSEGATRTCLSRALGALKEILESQS